MIKSPKNKMIEELDNNKKRPSKVSRGPLPPPHVSKRRAFIEANNGPK